MIPKEVIGKVRKYLYYCSLVCNRKHLKTNFKVIQYRTALKICGTSIIAIKPKKCNFIFLEEYDFIEIMAMYSR